MGPSQWADGHWLPFPEGDPIRGFLAVAVALLLLVPAVGLARSGPPTSVGGFRGLVLPAQVDPGSVRSAAGPGSAPSTSAAPTPPISCPTRISLWQDRYIGGLPPAAVRGTDNPGCLPGVDEEAVSLVSNESSSGDRFQVTVAMPGGFANDVRSLSAFWISLSVSGVPCSLDGRSVLRIDFLPPTNPLVFGPSASWQVKAPIWDLVPSGSCDPRCQNASALYVIEGAAFCEDDAVVSGIGAPGWSLNPSVQAGDVVKVAVVPGGASGLLVYLNDSTHPTSSTRWQYGSSQLVTGVAAEPFGPFANATTGWSFGGDLSVGYTNCPVGNGSAGAPPCTSYDAVSSSADAFPTLENATFYNASAFAYREAYPSAEVWSSSGGCSGQPNATGCADFTSQGGSGVYPPLSLDAHQGAVRIAYGTNASDRVGLLGGGPSEFAPDGSAVPGSPGTITHLAASYNNTTLTVSARATDPRGVGSVEFGGVWCFSGTNPPSANAFTGTKGIGPWNGSEDANWSITLPRGTNTTSGTFYYWAREFGPAAAPSGPPTFGRLAISGSTPCGAPVEGPASVAGATARSDGYRVNWILGAALGPAVHNFSLIALGGGSAPNVVVPVADPTARSAEILGLAPGVSYTIYVGVTYVDGGAFGVGLGSPFPAPPTLNPLAEAILPASLSLLQPGASELVSATASGGKAPYTYRFVFGDGNFTRLTGQGSSASILHAFSSYLGESRAFVVVNDSVGDTSASASQLIEVRATPGAVALTLSAGDQVVELNWTSPSSPSAAVTGYAVYYTEDPIAAFDLSGGWPITVGGVHPVYLRNTTSTNASFSATNGIPLYALVVAWNSWGAGSAPSGGPSIATPAPFVLESFRPAPSTPPGGPVPFTANFAAVTSSGTNDPVVQTVLSVDSFNPRLTLTATPTIAVSGNVSFLNASLTFPIQGTFTVVLHAEDRTFDTALVDLLTIYVGPGAAPTPSLVVSTPAPFVGRPVAFVGLASGSPGPYNYSWAFGDGQALFDGGPTPKHTYDTAGLFTIVLTVRDNTTGGVATSTLPVEISGAPVVRIAASVGTHGPLSYIFQAIELGGSGPPTLSWSFGDGTTSTGQNATHTYADPGLFTVRVIATDPAGLTASANLSISPGVARAATPFLASSSGIAIILLLLVGLIALGAISAFLFLRLRQQKVRPVERGPLYPERAAPEPPTEPSDRSDV